MDYQRVRFVVVEHNNVRIYFVKPIYIRVLVKKYNENVNKFEKLSGGSNIVPIGKTRALYYLGDPSADRRTVRQHTIIVQLLDFISDVYKLAVRLGCVTRSLYLCDLIMKMLMSKSPRFKCIHTIRFISVRFSIDFVEYLITKREKTEKIDKNFIMENNPFFFFVRTGNV